MDCKSRRTVLQRKLRRKKIDALLVSQPDNRSYLSGFSAEDHSISESSGVLLILAKGPSLLLTDFRYRLQAERESDMQVLIYKTGLIQLLQRLLRDYKVSKLAFESHYTLHSFSISLASLAEKYRIDLMPVSHVVEKMRLVKSEEEIDLIRQSVQLNEQIFLQAKEQISPGMSEKEVALMIESSMIRGGAESPSFDTIVASGENGALPHAVPTATKIRQDSAVTIDMGLKLKGYCSDLTRNFVLGKPKDKYYEIHRLVRKAQMAGMAAVRAGVLAKDVDRAARKIIANAGYGRFFGHSLGHGVGLAVHEGPRVSSRSRRQLKPGMVITIEPGIYIPGWGGIRLENMVVVRQDGCENLNTDTTWLDI